MNIVLFKSGLKSAYSELATKDPQTLYFVTDAADDTRGEFYKGGVFLGTGKLASTTYDGIVRLTNSITGSETTSDLIATTPYAVMQYVNAQLAATDAMIYAGSLTVANGVIKIHSHNSVLDFGITITDDTTLFSALTKYSAGWTWKVASSDRSAVTGFDKPLEAGDMVIATSDITSSTYSASDWTVIQTNIDGAVTGPASATNLNIAVFDGATGKVIKDGGSTIEEITNGHISSASFADDTTNSASAPVKMTLTKAGGSTVTGNIPVVSPTSAGVVPKGAEVSTQTQETKFLREDGTWAVPSYEVDTDTVRAIKVNGIQKLSTDPVSGAVDFINSTTTGDNGVNDLEVEFDPTGSTIKIKHTNSVTAGTIGSKSNQTHTGSAGGSITIDIPYADYDEHGHITAKGNRTDTINFPAHQTIKQDGITGATVNRYGTCISGSQTPTKEVTLTAGSATLEPGLTIRVDFTYPNSIDNPVLTLDGGTTTKSIKFRGSAITTGNDKELLRDVCEFVYDGTAWNLMAEMPTWGSI